MADGQGGNGIAAFRTDAPGAAGAPSAELQALTERFIRELYTRHHRLLISVIARFASRSDAEDIAQEAYFRIVRHVYSGQLAPDDIEKPASLLVRIGRHIAIDKHRQGGGSSAPKHVSLDDDDFDEVLLASDVAQDDVLQAKEELAIVRETIECLPQPTRTIFELHRFEGKPYRQIANELGVTYFEVVKQIAAAVHAIQTSLDGDENGMS